MRKDSLVSQVDSLLNVLNRSGRSIASNRSVWKNSGSLKIYEPPNVFSREDNHLEDLGLFSVREYIQYRIMGWHSCLLVDGSILEISLTFKRDRLYRQRLLYFPCPFHFVNEEDIYLIKEADESLFESLRRDSANDYLCLRSPVRFDFAEDESASYPKSHLTFNSNEVRIPSVAPISVGAFAHFIFKTFYSSDYLQLKDGLPRIERGDDRLDEALKRELHININSVI